VVAGGPSPSRLTARLVLQSRVVIDNDYAGDPDGLVALAHHLLSPTNRVEAITSSFLSPVLLPPGADAGSTSAAGARLAEELLGVVEPKTLPPVAAGAEGPIESESGGRSPASEAIVAAARAESDLPLVVACGGPLTNVAAALRAAPDVAGRFTLVWIGGSIEDGAFEYNRGTDPEAARIVLEWPGLEIHQIPLETYRRCAYSVTELEEDLGRSGALGHWLVDHFQDPPEWARVGGIWPLGDSPPVLITALSTESSIRTTHEERGTRRHVYTDVDFRLLVGDLLAKLRRHERTRSA
jgi:inosine-uridine nucleoside N-ribohydrolase